MKRTKIILAAALAALLSLPSCSYDFAADYPVVFAHRGCWLGDVQTCPGVTEYYIPENSLDGVRMAARMGYPTIELDVRWTLDSVLVCMHDWSVNRTMRNAADQSVIEGNVAVGGSLFEDLRTKYALASVDPQMRRKIPTLEEMLEECASCGIKPILHCDIAEGYDVAVSVLGEEFIAFGSEFGALAHAREAAPGCLILLDTRQELEKRGLEATFENINGLLDELGGNVGTSSMGMEICAPDMIGSLHSAGRQVQSSIYPRPNEACAVRNGADILLSDFCWRPAKSMKPVKRLTVKTEHGDEPTSASFDQCELGAVTISITGHGRCILTVEETSATGTVETFRYEFGAEDAGSVAERLSYRFWRTSVSMSLSAESEASSFTLAANLYEL
ncbi:MAG: hypothetical protein MJY84_00985 [Bacteroidales bacterium]|nr:hypothetical protein [Bacteroidales bacterium]